MSEYSTVFSNLDVSPSTHLRSSEVTIVRAEDTLATRGSAPPEAETDSRNPLPVSGFAARPEYELGSISPLDLVERPGGRYGLEVVIGPDDRSRVSNPSAWPWRVHGHMRMRFPNGQTYIGSGTMVNRHHVLTAGHCVFSRNDGGWATSVTFEAARNDASIPFGTVSATKLLSVKGWTENNLTDWDMGMLVLGADLGSKTGWFGVISGPDSILSRYRVNVSGYPGDKGGQQQWTHADVIKSVAAERFYYDIDTMGGQSGSGVWSTWTGQQGEKVCGIHTTGASSGNGATRISKAKFDRIVDWMTNN